MKYCVTVALTGCIFVEAETREEAELIANRVPTSEVSWCSWETTECIELDDDALEGDETP